MIIHASFMIHTKKLKNRSSLSRVRSHIWTAMFSYGAQCSCERWIIQASDVLYREVFWM